MRKLKFKLDKNYFEIIFTTFIRPLLEYGDIIWDICTQFEKKKLRKSKLKQHELSLEQPNSYLLMPCTKKLAGLH